MRDEDGALLPVEPRELEQPPGFHPPVTHQEPEIGPHLGTAVVAPEEGTRAGQLSLGWEF
jgi:hypothetical protein